MPLSVYGAAGLEEAAGAKYEPKFGCACFSGYDRGAEGGGGGGGGADCGADELFQEVGSWSLVRFGVSRLRRSVPAWNTPQCQDGACVGAQLDMESGDPM